MNIDVARERLTQLFQFFKAVEERRTPKIVDVNQHRWFLWLDSLPSHGKLNLIKPTPENGEWLVIKKPPVAPCPTYPETLTEWIDKGWDDPSFELAPKVRQRTIQRGNDYVVIEFDSSPERIRIYDEWNLNRALWRSVELPARSAGKVWDRLFSLHHDLKRDGEALELMLGDGLVSYKGQLEPTFHPLVLRKVELFFDPNNLEFKLIDTESKPELHSAIFKAAEFGGLPLKDWQINLESANLHPLDDEMLDHWLKGIAGTISDGEFIKGIPQEKSPHFCVGRSPVLFLRTRPTGKEDFITKILEDIPKAENFPVSLLSIIGLFSPDYSQPGGSTDDAYANEHEDILLTKKANAEQVDILRKLSKRDSVLVQGPPGTGKTHTIANLIGNFLAEGKSVLVTSHTTKALRVLRDQVAVPLQSLCVSLLDSDAKSRGERELAVRELAARLGDNPEQYKNEAGKLKIRRSEILVDLKKSRAELLLVVGGEYKPIVLAGTEVEPSYAAKEVAAGVGNHDWIPGVINRFEPMPLSDADVRQLYEIGNRISVLDEVELAEELPKLTALPSEELFNDKVREFNDLSQSNLTFRRDLWSLPKDQSFSLEEICTKVTEQVRYVQEMRKDSWRLAIIQAGIESGANAEIWNLLCENIEAVKILAQSAAKHIFEYGPKLADQINLDEQIHTLTQIEFHFQKNGSISWVKRNFAGWGRSIDAWRVGSKSPQTADEFLALKKLAELSFARQKLIERWIRLMCPIGVASLTDNDLQPEDFANQFVHQIRVLLGWHNSTWQPLEASLVAQGLAWSTLLSEAPQSTSPHHVADRLSFAVENLLPPVLSAEDKRRRLLALELQFAGWVSNLTEIQKVRKNPSLVVSGLINAIGSRSTISYATEFVKLNGLAALISDYLFRLSLLDKLLPFAKDWVTILTLRQEHITPDYSAMEAGAAWRWLQLSQELKSRAAMSLEEIQERVRRQTDELEKVTIEVVEKLAWAGLLSKVTNEQRQALLGWSAFIKKIGAGTGKLVPVLQRQAQVEMEKARGAVPVWIMPFSQVTRSFHPVRDKFDVIIIDEASQEDVLGLVPLYMAKKVIVVGDDEQVTPLAVGDLQEPIQQLINQWLGDLPSFQLFDLKTSVYDRAQIAFGSVIRLKEHFRCVPEIIQFSNALCYGYSIKPLRESAAANVRPALVAHRVQGSSVGQVNRVEAQEIVDLIDACISLAEYDGKSIGVMSLVGEKQADLISDLLRARLSPAVYEQRQILCGNPAQFQGDERDVIFLSLVDSKDEGLGPLGFRGDGADNMFKKRFNVASSRAKDQLWVVYSLDHQTQLKPDDIRRRLIEHAVDPSSLMNQLNAGLVKTESPFEAEVFKILTSLGYRVTPQWQVGAYRIDMVAEGNGKRLAIECDGERWHYDKVEEDLARQALLERLGWTFVRIRGSVFYRDMTLGRQIAMGPLLQKLSQLGIHPNYESVTIGNRINENSLLDVVRQKAAEIRMRLSAPTQEFPLVDQSAVSDLSHAVLDGSVQQDTVELTNPSLATDSSTTSVESSAPPIGAVEVLPSAVLKVDLPVFFYEGVRVFHEKLGTGTVMAVRKYGGQVVELDIGFDSQEKIKTLKPSYVKLSKR